MDAFLPASSSFSAVDRTGARARRARGQRLASRPSSARAQPCRTRSAKAQPSAFLAPRPDRLQPSQQAPRPLSAQKFRKRSECEDSFDYVVRLLHGFVLLPSGISVAGTGNAMN